MVGFMASSPSTSSRLWRSRLVFWVMLKRLWRPLGQFLLDNKWRLLILALLTAAVVTAIWHHERDWLYAFRAPERYPSGELKGHDYPVHLLARGLSYWGDFVPGTLPLFLVMWGLATWFNKRKWQRAAVAVLMAAAIAGVTSNVFRLTLGRPRPSANMEPGFYGLQRKSHFHGFPSGHAATAFGTAVPLFYVSPPLGVAATMVAGGVGWSRMQLERHFHSDILVGGLLGTIVGVGLGSRFVRRRRGVFRVKQPRRKGKKKMTPPDTKVH